MLNDREFITGVVLKVYTVKPQKPNSANRKVCKVRLLNQWPKKGDTRIGKSHDLKNVI
jgi:ribosomal protein S12